MDAISGETIVCQYHSLERLIAAASTPNAGSAVAAWNQTFQYDGFGNLLEKTLNGSALSTPVNAATNQLSSAIYDANGNRQVYRLLPNGNAEITFYGARCEKLEVYAPGLNSVEQEALIPFADEYLFRGEADLVGQRARISGPAGDAPGAGRKILSLRR